jgi:Ribbon-helix-helix protein, copG family
MNESAVTIRMTKAEAAILTAFATETGRTKTDILREAIRSLPTPLARPAKAAAKRQERS